GLPGRDRNERRAIGPGRSRRLPVFDVRAARRLTEQLLDARVLVDEHTLRGRGRWHGGRLSRLGRWPVRGTGLDLETLPSHPVQPLAEVVARTLQVGDDGGEDERSHEVDLAVGHLVVQLEERGQGRHAGAGGDQHHVAPVEQGLRGRRADLVAEDDHDVACLPQYVDQMRSEEHTSELQSREISYAVFCLKKKNKTTTK